MDLLHDASDLSIDASDPRSIDSVLLSIESVPRAVEGDLSAAKMFRDRWRAGVELKKRHHCLKEWTVR